MCIKFIHKYIAVLSIFFIVAPIYADNGFTVFKEKLRQMAIKENIASHVIKEAFDSFHTPLERVIKQDRNQSEFVLDFWRYYERGISKKRVQKGQSHYKKLDDVVAKITRRTGVPKSYLIAFWGLETNFGSYTGNFPLLRSLATLAYDKRRRSFFTKQFIAALKIMEKEEISAQNFLGSWAGAFGQNQFIPTTYLDYAVDGNGDGKRDTWNNIDDIMASSAHYLQKLGWRNGESWGRQVLLPKDFFSRENFFSHQKILASSNSTNAFMPLRYWGNLGVLKADGSLLPKNVNINARLLTPMGSEGPAFLVYHNFYIIKKWNNSDLYALNVGLLADKISHRNSHKLVKDSTYKKHSIEVIKNVQKILKKEGLYTSKIDGKIGAGTKKALFTWQDKNHMTIIDGWPNQETLRLMNVNP